MSARYFINPSGRLVKVKLAPSDNGPAHWQESPELAYAAALTECLDEDRTLRQRRKALRRRLDGIRAALKVP
jgi:hypothetical protein